MNRKQIGANIDKIRKQIGANIDKIRKAKGLTVSELGRRMGYSQEYLTVHKHIKDGPVRLETVVKYCDVLGCSIYDLLPEV